MILAHLCDEPKGLKTGMCMVLAWKAQSFFVLFYTVLIYDLTKKIVFILLQSLAYFPFAIANALTARLDDGSAPRYLPLSFL